MKRRMYGHRPGWKKRLNPTSAKTLRLRDARQAESLAAGLMAGNMGAFSRALGLPAPVELALRIDDDSHVTAVKDYAEASGIVEELREQHMEMGHGNSTFPRMTIVDLSTGATVAHVSWNGKVWPGEQWTPDSKPLYEPGKGVPMIQ
jgi:hypothetical protein